MRDIYIGLDHGKKGAIAAIDSDGEIISYKAMPLKNDSIDSFELHSYLSENFDDYDMDVVVYAEELHAIFNSSAKSTFGFGHEIGKAKAIIESLQFSYYEVKAKDWQKFIWTDYRIPEETYTHKTPKGKIVEKRDTKLMALNASKVVWPDLDLSKELKGAREGIIDSLLIAEYARRTHTTKEQS